MARIVFDLDGTLIDSVESLCRAGNRLLADLGRESIDAETYKGFVGRGMRVQVERLLLHSGGIPGGDPTPHLARFHSYYDADPVSATRLYPGVAEALGALRRAGHRLAVCTQKPAAPARELLKAFGLMPPVEGLTGGDSLDVLKPDPAMLFHAAAQIGDGPVIFVGDSEIDAQTARAAGVPFILFLQGYRAGPAETMGARACFGDWSDCPALIEGILKEDAA